MTAFEIVAGFGWRTGLPQEPELITVRTHERRIL